MGEETIAILSVGATLAGLVLYTAWCANTRFDTLSADMSKLSDRVSPIEGLIEGWLKPRPPHPNP